MRSFQSSGFRGLAAASVVLLAPVTVALGQATPQSQPAVPPPALVQAVPAEAAPAQPAQPAKIIVLPFEMVGGKPGDSWLSRSIQQSVLTDLMTASRSQIVTSTTPAADTAAAAELGHKLGARYIVFGQVHVNETALRVTGQIVSTENDSVVGTLKATGSMNDLFTLEDVLGNETRGAIGRIESPQTASAVPPQQGPAIQQTVPVQVVPYTHDSGAPYASPYDTSPVYPASPYDSDYGYYPGSYYPYASYFYGGIGFGGGFRGRAFGGGRGGGGGGLRGGGHAGGGHGGGHR
jgi:TolB-like protein